MQRVSKTKLLSGGALLAWQAVATLISFVGHGDMILALVPDPAWLVTLYAAVVTPPSWLTGLAISTGVALVAWSFLHRANAA
jgi:hypothetical protein